MLRDAIAALRDALQAQLLRVRAARPATWHVWLWLLEEWSLAHALLGAQRCDRQTDRQTDNRTGRDATLVPAVEEPPVLVLALAVPGALAPELQHYLHPCEADGSGQHDTRAAQGGWHVDLHLRIDDAQCCAPCAPV